MAKKRKKAKAKKTKKKMKRAAPARKKKKTMKAKAKRAPAKKAKAKAKAEETCCQEAGAAADGACSGSPAAGGPGSDHAELRQFLRQQAGRYAVETNEREANRAVASRGGRFLYALTSL